MSTRNFFPSQIQFSSLILNIVTVKLTVRDQKSSTRRFFCFLLLLNRHSICHNTGTLELRSVVSPHNVKSNAKQSLVDELQPCFSATHSVGHPVTVRTGMLSDGCCGGQNAAAAFLSYSFVFVSYVTCPKVWILQQTLRIYIWNSA